MAPNKKQLLPEPDLQPDCPETESDNLQSLVIEDVKYKTKLSHKFINRKTYQPADPSLVLSFIPGTICQVFVKKGSKVKAGEKLMELEAMKMINTIFAEQDAVIEEITVKPGDMVPKNQVLIRLKFAAKISK